MPSRASGKNKPRERYHLAALLLSDGRKHLSKTVFTSSARNLAHGGGSRSWRECFLNCCGLHFPPQWGLQHGVRIYQHCQAYFLQHSLRYLGLSLQRVYVMIPSAKPHIRFFLLPANKPTASQTRFPHQNQAAQKAWQNRELHFVVLSTMHLASVKSRTVPRIPISISGYHPKQPQTCGVTWPKHFCLTLFLREAFEHSTCIIFQTPHPSHKRSKLWDSWKRLEEPVWLETAKQKGQR